MIHKSLVNLLILKKELSFEEILTSLGLFKKEESGLLVPTLKCSDKEFLDSLDSLLITFDFLIKNSYIPHSGGGPFLISLQRLRLSGGVNQVHHAIF